MGNEVLHGIVERQIKVYGDLIDRIVKRIRDHNLDSLAEEIIALKTTYGLGKFNEVKDSNFKVRPRIYEDEVKKQILDFLNKHRGQKFKKRDIFINLSGRTSEYIWTKVNRQLVAEQKIKCTRMLYWVE